ncbi:MAG: S8 family serine peptidase [Acetobacteraceae bacterium]|nr:S8 family serine peptidase [Acetobacteraceae bacterium]
MRKAKFALASLLCLLVVVAAGAAWASVPSTPEVELVPGEILVQFHPGVSEAARAEAHAALGGKVIYTSPFAGFQRVAIPEGATIDRMVARYSAHPLVKYAQPNSVCHAFMTPNDPLYPRQWHFPFINAPQAWDLTTGSTSVVVAVVDTGVAYENYGAYALAPDLAGCTFVPGYDTVNFDSHPNDDHYHGTHVCGTVAQTTNNSLGVAGMAPNTAIMPVKVLNSAGSGTAQTLIDGLYWAADHGANVITMSLGWAAGYDPGPAVHDAIIYCYNKGIVLVAAAGNGNTSVVSYPAAYPECIAVGALASNNTRAYYSQWGSALDITAPGGDGVDRDGDGYGDDVLQQTFASGQPTNFGYYYLRGTSMATPHVTGVVALMMARGATGVENIRSILYSTAIDLGTAGWDETFGWGKVDAYAAVSAVGPAQPVMVSHIDMALNKTGVSTWATAKVYVVDQYGAAVSGAAVSGRWSGATTDTDSGVTDSLGTVTLASDKVKKPKSGTVFTFTVTNITKGGYVFQPGPNDSNSITVP